MPHKTPATRTRRKKPTATPDEFETLNFYRLQHGLTWSALSQRMRQKGYYVKPRTLHHLCTEKHRNRAYERTIFNVRQFLLVANIANDDAEPSRKPRNSEANP